jgi:hypothetical protein
MGVSATTSLAVYFAELKHQIKFETIGEFLMPLSKIMKQFFSKFNGCDLGEKLTFIKSSYLAGPFWIFLISPLSVSS